MRQLLRRRSTVPIVTISVAVSAAGPADCLDVGADDYMTSPHTRLGLGID